ncbi:MAG: nucleotidyltransferase family protein [Lachnospiraceae bacterium]
MDGIILASGNSLRFGENKLKYSLQGKPLYRHVAQLLYEQYERGEIKNLLFVTQYSEIIREAAEYYPAMIPVLNRNSDFGISQSIRVGLAVLANINPQSAACMFSVADQPFLRERSIQEAIRLFEHHEKKIVAFSHREKTGNPVIFPAMYYQELMNLSGDTGGKQVVRLHEQEVIHYEADLKELEDIDEKNSPFIR